MTFAESETARALGRARPDSTQVSSSSFEGGGRDAAPASEPRLFARLTARVRSSVWAPVALKVAGIGLGMLALSGIGAWSILSPPGVDLARAEGSLHKDILGAWLAGGQAPAPAASAPRVAPAPSAARPTDSEPRDAGSDAAPKGASGLTADGKVILNLASVEELERLPGVGAKRAQHIIELRHKLGRFKKLTDLLRVKGIGAKGLRRMLPHLVLDPPAPT